MNTKDKKVKIIGGWPEYIGQIGTVIRNEPHFSTLVTVEMSDGTRLNPYIRGNGKYSESDPEAEWVEESYIGRRVKLDTRTYGGELAKVVTEQMMSNGHTLWEVETEGGSTRRPWASINTDPLYRQCELLPEETITSTNNQNQSTMNTQSNTQAPETFYITSQYPEIMKVFWEEMKKVGYTDVSCATKNWQSIASNSVYSKNTSDYTQVYISTVTHNPTPRTEDKQYTLPQQWTEALKHITDAAKYWEEVEKKPVYKTGDWVVIMENQLGDPVGTVTQIVKIQESEVTVKNMTTPKSVCTIWSASISKIRPATAQEIAAAQSETVTIGTSKTVVTIKKGSIKADGTEIPVNKVRNLIISLTAIAEAGLPWATVATIDIAPTCSRGVKGVTLAELEEIVRVYEKLTKN